jgi:outer membrane protein assembly factor BamB
MRYETEHSKTAAPENLDTVSNALEKSAAVNTRPGPRLWPAWLVLLLQAGALSISVTASIDMLPRFLIMMLGPVACLLLFLIWLLAASRLRWWERLLYPGIAVVLALSVAGCMDKSVGITLLIHGIPLTLAAMTIGLFLGRSWPIRSRVVLVSVLLAAVWIPFALVRVEGFTGAFHPEFAWRWSPSSEARAVAQSGSRAAGKWEPADVQWPGYRGPGRNSRAVGVGAALNWSAAPPQQRWRIPIGAGWSSFACVSGRLFTQEQRGEQELVTCYDADTGELIWQFAYPNRFADVVSGDGPRATPAYADGRLYAYGAKAVLTCLDAGTGQKIWQHDLMKEVNAALPVWGFANSPLVMGDVVMVYAGGDGDNGLLAFHKTTGVRAWQIASHGMNFSSAQPVTLAGRVYALFADESGLQALEPATGRCVWSYRPRDWAGAPICQPQQIEETSLLVPLGDGAGLARLEVQGEGGSWRITERWSNRKQKPTFNDFVYYKGHFYGFDRNSFCCVDAATGTQKWRAARYDFGQVLLLAEVGQLLVTTESGAAFLLAADPERHLELGTIRLFSGKTWNHPVVVGQRLFMRNGAEAVCLEW